MKLSCICLTYGRPRHLEEAVESFIKQSCDCATEMVILNTCPDQKLSVMPSVALAGVIWWHSAARPKSLGEARNIAIRHAQGDIIVTWDDDDIYLPGYLQSVADAFAANPSAQWVHLSHQFYMEGGRIKKIIPGTCNVFAFTKAAWVEVGGYNEMNVGEDRSFIGKLSAVCSGVKVEIPPQRIGFIYRWGTGTFHISGLGDDRPGKTNSWERARIDLERRFKSGAEKRGVIEIKPAWRQDYSALARDFLEAKRIGAPHGTKLKESGIRLFHAVERHDTDRDPRRERARASWNALYDQGVIPCHYWQYERNATEIGDPRRLPFLTDVLAFALQQAGDSDIVFLTNDDNILHPQLADDLVEHVLKHGPCGSQRVEFHGCFPKLTNTIAQLATSGRPHLGRDLFAATKSQWLSLWDQIGDPVLGASDWDMHLACLFRMCHGIRSNRKNIGDIMPPAEIRRGYVMHEAHKPQWAAPGNINESASQKWNRQTFRAWAAEFLPELEFKPGMII